MLRTGILIAVFSFLAGVDFSALVHNNLNGWPAWSYVVCVGGLTFVVGCKLKQLREGENLLRGIFKTVEDTMKILKGE